ncbi:MAG: TIR domain-containing protein [Clostridia bacterium]|nr:TIR domain-containing protein [Clostridia bacterium]
MGYVFISYSSKNQAAADAMKKLLEKNNIATWMAPGDIPPASTYAKEINSAIRNCACMVLMLTNDAQNSIWVAKEVERAVHYCKPVLPIQLEDVVLNDEFEFYISTNQIVAVNRIDETYAELQRALAAIRSYTGDTPSKDPVSPPAPAHHPVSSPQPSSSAHKTASRPHPTAKQSFAQEMGKKLAVGLDHAIGLKNDGTLLAAGTTAKNIKYDPCDVQQWRNITAVAAGFFHTVGLRFDRTVITTDKNTDTSNVSDWTDITAVTAGAHYTAGLKKDGTVVIGGPMYIDTASETLITPDVSSWKNIIAIAAGAFHLVGLQQDGTVIATGKNDYGQCRTKKWTDIVAIAAGNDITAGLRADGTVVTTSVEENEIAAKWTDIVAVSYDGYDIYALKADGTTITTSYNNKTYSDVIALSSNCFGSTLFLKADGSVIYEGSEKSIENKTKHWNLFK